jgi:hypothetical protein
MLNAGGNKGKTERRGRKAESRKQAGGQQAFEAEPRPDQLRDAQEQINEQISSPAASTDISPLETSATDIVPTEPVVASIATIVNAYGACTRKSFELTWSFLEKLSAVRSFDTAFEVQTEFAKQTSENFLAESRKIFELHSELTRQRVVQLEGVVAKITQTTFVLRATYP